MSGKAEKAMRREVERQLEEIRAKRENNGVEPKNMLDVDPERLHPVGDLVLLGIEIEKVTEGGIIVPDSAQQPHGFPPGRVLAIGPKVEGFKVGELVLAAPRDVTRIDTLLWVVPASKILCHVDPKPSLLIAAAH